MTIAVDLGCKAKKTQKKPQENIGTPYQNDQFLSLPVKTIGMTRLGKTYLVTNPEDRFSYDVANFINILNGDEFLTNTVV